MTPSNKNFLQDALPSSEESERCIIGGVLMDVRMMADAAEVLVPEDFYSPLHRRVYAAMIELFSQQKTIDPVHIGEILSRESSLESIGGVPVITNLSFGLPFFTDISEYVEIVRQKRQVRDLLKSCDQISAMATAGEIAPSEILEHAQTAINAVCADDKQTGFTSVGEISFERLNKAIALRNREIPATGLLSGLTAIDHITNGFQPSDLIIIGGRPSMGKSALAGQIAMNACTENDGAVIAIFSLEMSREQYTDRLICALAEVDNMKFRAGALNDAELERCKAANVRLNQMALDIDDSSSINALQMRSKLLQIKHRRGRLDAVVIDFLQRMTATRKTEGRQQEVSRIAQDLKTLAKDLGVPVIALSSLSRACESRNPPRPMMSDLRESGDIESEADLVAFLYRANYYNHAENPLLAEFLIEKHRNGPTKSVNLHFLREYTRFSDYYGN